MTENIKSALQSDMKAALRAQDKVRLGAIRLILAALKQHEVGTDAGRITLSDDQIMSILNKMIKQRRESITQYKAGNRKDLVQNEENEIRIIQQYLPRQLSPDEIIKIIDETIKETGAISFKEMGKVMGALKSKLAGKADMAMVSAKVKEKLQ